MKKPKDRSIDHRRTRYGPGDRERAFADAWERGNRRRPGVDFGHGILQDLFFNRHRKSRTAPQLRPCHVLDVMALTARDRMIAATVFQWLGTNCGFSFLEQTLKAAGYTLNRPESVPTVEIQVEISHREAQLLDRMKKTLDMTTAEGWAIDAGLTLKDCRAALFGLLDCGLIIEARRPHGAEERSHFAHVHHWGGNSNIWTRINYLGAHQSGGATVRASIPVERERKMKRAHLRVEHVASS